MYEVKLGQCVIIKSSCKKGIVVKISDDDMISVRFDDNSIQLFSLVELINGESQ